MLGGGRPVIVDRDEGMPGPVEKRCGDGGAEAGGAVDPHLAVGDLVEAALKIVEGDVHGAVDVTLGPFVVAPDIEHNHIEVGSGVGQLRE